MRVRDIGKVLKFPFFVGFWLTNAVTFRHVFQKKMGINEYARVYFTSKLGAKIGKGVRIRKGQFVTNFEHMVIGDNVTIGPFSRFFLFDHFEIGDDVEIGSGLTVHTSEHKFDNPDLPLSKQGNNHFPVVVGSDIYMGSNVTILPGSRIGDRVVIAAGSVVKGELEGGYLYAGIPAQKKRKL